MGNVLALLRLGAGRGVHLTSEARLESCGLVLVEQTLGDRAIESGDCGGRSCLRRSSVSRAGFLSRLAKQRARSSSNHTIPKPLGLLGPCGLIY